MSNPLSPPPRDSNARKKAQNHFEAAEARTTLVKRMVEAESAALDARTAKLKALRLAKEEADRAEALANPPPPSAPKKPRKKVVRA
jgi:multidrug resistance efflux pump